MSWVKLTWIIEYVLYEIENGTDHYKFLVNFIVNILSQTHIIVSALINSKGIQHMQLPKYIDQVLLEQLVYEQLGGFLLILQPNGKIIFVSHPVENLLGHLQVNTQVTIILLLLFIPYFSQYQLYIISVNCYIL